MDDDVSVQTQVCVAPHHVMQEDLCDLATPEVHVGLPHIGVDVLVAELKGTLEKSEGRRRRNDDETIKT